MDFITITIIISVLMVFSISLHECGHYFAAKRNALTVNVFNVGIGPTLLKFQYQETKISFKLIPLGGFIEINEDRFDYSSVESGLTQEVLKSMKKDVFVLFAGPLVNLFLAVFSFATMISLLVMNNFIAEPSQLIHQIAGITWSFTIMNILGFILNLIPFKGSDGSLILKIYKDKQNLKKASLDSVSKALV